MTLDKSSDLSGLRTRLVHNYPCLPTMQAWVMYVKMKRWTMRYKQVKQLEHIHKVTLSLSFQRLNGLTLGHPCPNCWCEKTLKNPSIQQGQNLNPVLTHFRKVPTLGSKKTPVRLTDSRSILNRLTLFYPIFPTILNPFTLWRVSKSMRTKILRKEILWGELPQRDQIWGSREVIQSALAPPQQLPNT